MKNPVALPQRLQAGSDLRHRTHSSPYNRRVMFFGGVEGESYIHTTIELFTKKKKTPMTD
jgi:hypothetical protein